MPVENFSLGGHFGDEPPQALEQFEVNPHNCGNCPFSEIDKDDRELYCHEGSAQGFPIVVMEQPSAHPIYHPANANSQPQPKVLKVVGFFPSVSKDWGCWKHPGRQAERRKIEGPDLIAKTKR